MRSSSTAPECDTATVDELAWCKHPAMSGNAITYRQLVAAHLARIGEIDRTERIESLYVQHGARLEERTGDWSAPQWFRDGHGEHSVAHQRAECERHLAAGGIALGAFAEGRLVGIGIVTPHIRPGVAQLAFLHVSNEYRARGIGGHLTGTLERFAREQGDTTIVVSATPSLNTVRFYLGRGFELMSEPLPELYEAEPEDVHMLKQL
jgi:predicted N-acetyltransferase YhbS